VTRLERNEHLALLDPDGVALQANPSGVDALPSEHIELPEVRRTGEHAASELTIDEGVVLMRAHRVEGAYAAPGGVDDEHLGARVLEDELPA
jgi:hypothetical protein